MIPTTTPSWPWLSECLGRKTEEEQVVYTMQMLIAEGNKKGESGPLEDEDPHAGVVEEPLEGTQEDPQPRRRSFPRVSRALYLQGWDLGCPLLK